MKYTLPTLALASVASARALYTRDSQCCFGIKVSGNGVGGSLGQLSDGQNRVGPGQSGATYCINNGQITDNSGRGCVVTGPTHQFQCDQGSSPTGGFSLSGSGSLNFQGNGSFYACPTDDQGNYNIYTQPVSNMPKCVSVGLSSTNGTCAAPSSSAISSSSAAPSSSPAAAIPASNSSASCQASTIVSTLPAKTVTQYITQQNNVTVPVTQYKTQVSESTDTAYQTQTAYQTETEEQTSITTQYQTINMTKTVPTTVYKTQEETTTVPTTVEETTTNYKTEEETTTAYQTHYLTTTQQSPPQTVTITQSASPITTTITQSASPITVVVTQSASPVTEQISVTQEITTSVEAAPVTQNFTSVQTQEVTTSIQASPVTQTATTTAQASPVTQTVSASASPSSSGCPRNLPAMSNYQSPRLIIPVNQNQPDTAYGTQYNAYVGGGNSTIFNFDIPQNFTGKTCELIFTFPKQSQLETSFVSESGSGGIDFKQLSSPATQSTSFNNAPGVAQDFGVKNVTAGNAYSITSGQCQAGKTLTYELTATGTKQISLFQDYNPCPNGLWILAN